MNSVNKLVMSQHKGSVKEGEKCGVCENNVGERDAGIQCEVCEKWFHTGCVKILEDIYKVLGKVTNLHWFCEPYNNDVRKFLVNFSKLNERICQIELEQKIAKVNCVKLNERVEKIEKFNEMEKLNERD